MKKIILFICTILLLSSSNSNAQQNQILNKLIKEAGSNIYLKDFKFELKPGEEKQFFPINVQKKTKYEWYAYINDHKQLRITVFDKFGNTIYQSKETDKGIINFSLESKKDTKYLLNVKNLSEQKMNSTILLTTSERLHKDFDLFNPKLDKLLEASSDSYLKDFEISLDPESEARHSVVLMKNTTYSISTYLDKPDQFNVKLYEDKTDKILHPTTEIVNNEALYQLYSISNTGVYHLFVRNNSAKAAETVTLLALHERSYNAPDVEQKQPNIKEEKSYYFVVDQMPKFNGSNKNGYPEFKDFIRKEIRYPKEASENQIEGKVFVTFLIAKDGYIRDAKVSRGVHPSIDQEALRVVYSSPRWEPGINDGEPVDVMFTFPITFKLP